MPNTSLKILWTSTGNLGRGGKADFSKADRPWQKADLADFVKANFVKANFVKADFVKADFTKAEAFHCRELL